MKLTFYKYQGTGNDFIIIDNRENIFPAKNNKLVAKLCDRKFGIGADGLILLENDTDSDFKMIYFNADGNTSTMCGNGGRCLVAFAKYLNIINEETTFKAIDGLHYAFIKDGQVSLQMIDVKEIKTKPNASFLNTGSPHHVQMVENLKEFNVFEEGAKLRYGLYGATGSNINFVEQINEESFSVRTYERGVEDETLSCGTGVTAVAIAMHNAGITKKSTISVHVVGGHLKVSFTKNGSYTDVFLNGSAEFVFKGEIEC